MPTRRPILLLSVTLLIAGAATGAVYRHELASYFGDSSVSETPADPPLPIAPAVAPAAPNIDYNRDILPILAANCFTCHGPDKDAGKGGLRLHTRELAMAPAKSGAVAIKPGNAAESELVRRIFAEADDERMPPPRSNKMLTPGEKELLRRWIDAGAEYSVHWAFVTPVRPAPPKVKDEAWVKNEIDAFVLNKLEQAGINPSPAADRVTLIRRLSLDLRGLPPTVKEVDDFLRASDVMPQAAYEALVERMLASPRYGEKMAQLWLDLARFGDTSGYHQDSTRQMWLWRDWVIDAFNSNMPFDRFTVEQLAGDLLPNPTVSQRIATGFNRNTRFNEEGGVDPEEFVLRYNVDRTSTLGQVWLGLTVGCAECHDHKYDPISQKEFYQLFAYFTGIKEPMVSMNHNQPLPPLLKVPRPEQTKALADLNQELALADQAMARELKRTAYTDPLGDDPARSQTAWEKQARDDEELPKDIRAAIVADRSEAQKKLLRGYYLRKVYADTREAFQALDQDIEETRKKVRTIEDAIPHTLVCEEMDKPRPAFILIRGNFEHKGPKVERGVPAVFRPLPKGAPNNRLGLARWLVSPEHPLTARVTVNRLWARVFGTGIVRSLGDFGTQGDYPSHPELLDWLATDFVASGWDVKALLKKIVLSNTYQQASTYRHEKSDPDNRLLYRAPRFRLSAEEIRDSALAISGLLSDRVGGPSVMPYQPADYYKGKYEAWPWAPSPGEEQYRRGLYVFWRRTSLHPMFAIFDAPTREECIVARSRTNTPLQALVTLNDPTFVEAARVFAQRLLTSGPAETADRLKLAFRSAVAREPTEAELRALTKRYETLHEHYGKDREAASKLVNAGAYPRPADLDVVDHAAWTAVVNIVLNLDEVVMRE